MLIKLKSKQLVLKPFKLEDLPNLVVLTGENGVGKTQLLTALNSPKFGEIFDEHGRRLRNTLFLGHGLNIDTSEINEISYYEQLKNRWNNLRVLLGLVDLFMQYDPIGDLESIKLNLLLKDFYSTYKRDGATLNFTSDIPPNEFQEAIDLVKATKKKEGINFIDFFIFLKFPILLSETTLSLIFHQFALKQKYYPQLVIGVTPPWDLFNKLLISAGFDYLLDTSVESLLEKPIPIKLKSQVEPFVEVEINKLSSGEKTFISLIIVLYNTDLFFNHGTVLLLDEPDAFLHPSLAGKFIKALYEVLVREKGIKVIMSTHSPSTVALSPPESIFVMKRNGDYPENMKQNEAIRHLTFGLTSLNISLDDRKQIYTEAKSDQLFYQQIFERLQAKEMLNKNQYLTFIQVSRNKDTEGGGFQKVTELTDSLYANGEGNVQIYGMIDWDCNDSRALSDRIFIFGERTRYNIENFIYDPLFIAAVCLQKDLPNKSPFGLEDKDNKMDYLDFKQNKLQKIIDTISAQIKINVDWEDANCVNGMPVTIQLLNKMTVRIPEWYLYNSGHLIEKACRNTFNTLRSHKTPEMISDIVVSYFQWLPIEVKTTFEKLQAKRSRED
jgi:predicted ATPase